MMKLLESSVPCHKNIEMNQSVLVPVFGCLFPQNESADSYCAMFLFAGFYCIQILHSIGSNKNFLQLISSLVC